MGSGAENYTCFLEGDESGLEQIIQQYADGLLLYVNGYVKNLATAEDIVEQTFVRLVLKKPKFKTDASFKTWLFAIGRNAALSHLRKTKYTHIPLENCPELVDGEANLERRYIQREEQRCLLNAMKQLKSNYYQVLWLIYFEGFSQKETARIMGKTVHNIETLAYRARLALKEKLLQEGFAYENI